MLCGARKPGETLSWKSIRNHEKFEVCGLLISFHCRKCNWSKQARDRLFGLPSHTSCHTALLGDDRCYSPPSLAMLVLFTSFHSTTHSQSPKVWLQSHHSILETESEQNISSRPLTFCDAVQSVCSCPQWTFSQITLSCPNSISSLGPTPYHLSRMSFPCPVPNPLLESTHIPLCISMAMQFTSFSPCDLTALVSSALSSSI